MLEFQILNIFVKFRRDHPLRVGYINFVRFSTNICLYVATIKIWSELLWNVNRKSYALY